jgi:hypothetical protein
LLRLGASASRPPTATTAALIAAAHLEPRRRGAAADCTAGAPLDVHVNNLHGRPSKRRGGAGRRWRARHQATLKALIDAGANLQLADRHGQAAIGFGAFAVRCPAMVRILEMAGEMSFLA